MSNEEILDFCKRNRVGLTFRFDPLINGFRIVMRKREFETVYVLTTNRVESIAEHAFIVKGILLNMLNELDKEIEKTHKH